MYSHIRAYRPIHDHTESFRGVQSHIEKYIVIQRQSHWDLYFVNIFFDQIVEEYIKEKERKKIDSVMQKS